MPLGRSFAFPSFLCVHRDAYLCHMHSRHSGPVARISFCCFSFHSGPIPMLPGPVWMLPCFRDDPDIPTLLVSIVTTKGDRKVAIRMHYL